MSGSNAVAIRPVATPVAIVDDWTQARIDLVLTNYCNGAPEATAMAFIALARRRRLSPEEKQIYLVKRGDKWSMETGIDGLRLIADRTEAYAGRDLPVFGEAIDGHPDSASFTVYKIVQGQRVPFSAIAFWEEFRPKDDRQAFMWKQMPRHMLAKVAEAQALRSAFPADMSGLYIEEEMQQAGAPSRVTVTEVPHRGKGGAQTRSVPARTGSRTQDPNALATPEQIKALVDIGKRKRLGTDDIGILMGGLGWETRVTHGQAAERIGWLGGATTEQIDAEMAAAMERLEAEAAQDMAEIDAAVGRTMAP